MSKVGAYLRLIRPANIVTSIADIIAGIAISGFFIRDVITPGHLLHIALLCVSTAALYGGGIAFNDIFDAEVDRRERPERPIPSGIIAVRPATIFASLLLMVGILAGSVVNPVSGLLAISIASAALVYNKWGKHHPVLGPLNMGLCRGLNLLLGISIVPGVLQDFWYLAIVPIVYISAITLISRGEVHGSRRSPIYMAFALYTVVILSILYFSFEKGMEVDALFFVLPFAVMIITPLIKAAQQPTGVHIRKAVKAGVISLIIMDAAWVSAAGEIVIAIVVALLFPLSFWLARWFAAT